MSYTNTISSQKTISTKALDTALVLLASWIIAASAQFVITLPISPVPITGQTLAVLVIGLALGKNLGAAAVGVYILQGALGLPIFAGGKSGLIVLAGPTGGYLAGFLAAAYVVGILNELRHDKSVIYDGFSLLIGNLIIYIFGLFWLARFVGESLVLQVGLIPFLVGDGLKIMLGVMILWGTKKIRSLVNPDR